MKVAQYLTKNRQILYKYIKSECAIKQLNLNTLAKDTKLTDKTELSDAINHFHMSQLTELLPKLAQTMHVPVKRLKVILFSGDTAPLKNLQKHTVAKTTTYNQKLVSLLKSKGIDINSLPQKLSMSKDEFRKSASLDRPTLKFLILISMVSGIQPSKLCKLFNYSVKDLKNELHLIKARTDKRMLNKQTTFGGYLHTLRIQRGLPLHTVAKYAKTSSPIIGMIEHNDLKRTHLTALFYLADLYHLNTYKFIKECPKYKNIKTNDNMYKINALVYMCGMNCKEFARKCHISKSAFYKISRGVKSCLTPTMKKRIIKPLNLPSNYLTSQYYQRTGMIPHRTSSHNNVNVKHEDYHWQHSNTNNLNNLTLTLHKYQKNMQNTSIDQLKNLESRVDTLEKREDYINQLEANDTKNYKQLKKLVMSLIAIK